MAAATPGAPKPKLEPLRGSEVAAVAGAVVAIYGGALCVLHCIAEAPVGGAMEQPGYWGTLPSAWDHPEPNYAVSPGIGEFWSVLTTIPVAGALLLYEGLKYGYGGKVLGIYCLACGMYSLAFTAHLTLQRVVFSTTVVAVMSNALLTFAEFSYIVHRWLESKVLRALVVAMAEALLVFTVATLPYALRENGGVWTLFTVQAPGVFLATGLAAGLARVAKSKEERSTYKVVLSAGLLLSSAMVLSLLECLIGFEYGFFTSLWGFPWLHVAIHILEQVGIYLFGVGVAALQSLLLQPLSRPGAELRTLGRCFVYLYCPMSRGGLAEPLAAAEPDPAKTSEAKDTKELKEGTDDKGELPQRGRPALPGAARDDVGLMRQRRVRSPGVVAPKPSV